MPVCTSSPKFHLILGLLVAETPTLGYFTCGFIARWPFRVAALGLDQASTSVGDSGWHNQWGFFAPDRGIPSTSCSPEVCQGGQRWEGWAPETSLPWVGTNRVSRSRMFPTWTLLRKWSDKLSCSEKWPDSSNKDKEKSCCCSLWGWDYHSN